MKFFTPLVIRPDKPFYITTIDPGIRNLAVRMSLYSPDTDRSKTVILKRFDLKPDKTLDYNGSYLNLVKIMEELLPEIKKSSVIGVESQMPFNHELTRMEQHIISSLMVLLKDRLPSIVSINSKLKNRFFKKRKENVKKLSVEKAKEFLLKNGEDPELLLNEKKKDDLSDTILYEQLLIDFIKCLNTP
ncbi:MAG: hypothetical protein KatS3mg101_0911 [Patescibacteria group bacterium]|nr:MAG: hypothetical protein KatS3mg101_0911 [Patescibacteria group bacterium]